MNVKIFLLSAAALSLAASASYAAPSELQYYTARTQVRLQSLLRATGIAAQSVSVRATVGPDGQLTGMKVVRSSGSRAADRAAQTVLRKIVVTDPPLGLSDGAVTLNVNQAPIVQTTAR